MKTKLKIGVILICVAAGGAVYLWQSPELAWEDQAVAEVPTRFTAPKIVCSGRVESVKGEVDLSSQTTGQLMEVLVTEGDLVQKDDVLAVMDVSRQKAEMLIAKQNVRVARAKLDKLEAGNGKEEIQQALHAVRSVEAQLRYQKKHLKRNRELVKHNAVSKDEYDKSVEAVGEFEHLLKSRQQQYEAQRRGALPEEVAVAKVELELAEAQLERARVEYGYRLVRSPMSGVIQIVYRHAGDSVTTDEFAPIVRLVDTRSLRLRLEIDEIDVRLVREGMQGNFEIRGSANQAGELTMTAIVPAFGPKRLFNPDTSARLDSRTLDVLCRIDQSNLPLYPGQRVTAFFEVTTDSQSVPETPPESDVRKRTPAQP